MRKGFTLVELIAVIAILGAIIVIGAPKLLGTINGQKEKSYEKIKEIVIAAARNYVIDEDINESVSIPISDLCRYVDCPIINPVTETEIQGCINVTKTGGIDSYTYSTDCGYTELVVDLNGGSTTQNFEPTYMDGTIIELIEPTREGYSFAGWEVIIGDSTIENNVLTIGKENTTIYALWESNPTLTVDLNGGTSSQTFAERYKSGTVIQLIPPTKERHVFSHFEVVEGNGTISGNTYTQGTEDTVIRCVYTEITASRLSYDNTKTNVECYDVQCMIDYLSYMLRGE